MEPITLIVTALALGAAAGFKSAGEQAVKDAYGALKSLLQKKYANVSLAQLEQAPESAARQAVVTEDLQKTTAAQDVELLRRAQAVLKVVQDKAPETAAAINVSFEVIKAVASIDINKLSAAGDITLDVGRAEAGGDIRVTGLTAGNPKNS